MTKHAKCGFLFALLVAGSHVGLAQAWNLTLTNGDVFSDVRLERVSNDTLYFRHKSNFLDRTELGSLSQLVRSRRSAILPAALIGGAGGGAVGYVLKPVAVEQGKADVYSALFGAVVGSAAGFFIGNALQPDDVFAMGNMNNEERKKLLRSLMQ